MRLATTIMVNICLLNTNWMVSALFSTTPCPRSGAAVERSNLMFKKRWLCGGRRVERSYSTFKVRRGGQGRYP